MQRVNDTPIPQPIIKTITTLAFCIAMIHRRLGVLTGAERMPPPGKQAQRTSHPHRTHDTSRHDRSMARSSFVARIVLEAAFCHTSKLILRILEAKLCPHAAFCHTYKLILTILEVKLCPQAAFCHTYKLILRILEVKLCPHNLRNSF